MIELIFKFTRIVFFLTIFLAIGEIFLMIYVICLLFARDLLTYQYMIIQREVFGIVEVAILLTILIGLTDFSLIKQVYFCQKKPQE